MATEQDQNETWNPMIQFESDKLAFFIYLPN